MSGQQAQSNIPLSPIAGSVLPLQRAEELIASLQDVVSVRISASQTGGVDAIHVLVAGDTPAKSVVRNIESALMAQLGLRVDHRKISVAATARRPTPTEMQVIDAATTAATKAHARAIYFEDVEVRGSRARGVTCRVTLRVGAEQYVGEAEERIQSDRSRVDVAARAALTALATAGAMAGVFSLEGVKLITAFDREFVFAGVMARDGRESHLLTGSCEVKESAETAVVLAVLDATNRWVTSKAVGGPVVFEDRRSPAR